MSQSEYTALPRVEEEIEIDSATNAIGSESSRSSIDSLVLPPPPPPSPWRVAANKIQTILIPSFLQRDDSAEERPSTRQAGSSRISTDWLDGLRGVASFFVFLFHHTISWVRMVTVSAICVYFMAKEQWNMALFLAGLVVAESNLLLLSEPASSSNNNNNNNSSSSSNISETDTIWTEEFDLEKAPGKTPWYRKFSGKIRKISRTARKVGLVFILILGLVHVTNKLQYNGTTIHWHGLWQKNTMEMDGVNGVTQCPIAPEDTFTYEFRAYQYGTSWYHSHYSLQYADGLAGPTTIHGPSSANYDEAKDPILITDWNHRSAFQDWERELTRIPTFPRMNSILINGIGNFAGSFPRERFNMTVTRGKKYILRVINTSVDTTFVFSIDNHQFEVMSSDFVPIKPYNVTHILIGIGQRYHIVLHADPFNTTKYPASTEGNYWIRTVPADGCKGFEVGNEPDERQGILRYNASSTSVPTTWRDPYGLACRDENYTNLVSIHEWHITPVKLNNRSKDFDIGLDTVDDRPVGGNNFSWWSFGENPLWVDFSNPTITGLNRTDPWPKDYVVVPAENQGGWVYLVITAPKASVAGKKRVFAPVAHPLHLHGHDFALLAQGNDSTLLNKTNGVTLKFDNPPRRDVALIPAGGYLVVAFKADNPGSWLFHCHIAWHASSGLALQIMEREEDLKKMMTEERLAETRRVCENWDKWYSNTSNHWNASGPFQDDSGV
ncbi:hypothetical protein CEP54_008216 [Fusarium duplospermum]|uniref:Laccase n=1 Tax=Fusarium duplospermum TaxID=1325734 RepID=A0A428PX50_9HYPO|nr:hypothetical protein CEP54_008216 [Fusarium duplospermum]